MKRPFALDHGALRRAFRRVALGLIAGDYPALRASAISPIEAIRG